MKSSFLFLFLVVLVLPVARAAPATSSLVPLEPRWKPGCKLETIKEKILIEEAVKKLRECLAEGDHTVFKVSPSLFHKQIPLLKDITEPCDLLAALQPQDGKIALHLNKAGELEVRIYPPGEHRRVQLDPRRVPDLQTAVNLTWRLNDGSVVLDGTGLLQGPAALLAAVEEMRLNLPPLPEVPKPSPPREPMFFPLAHRHADGIKKFGVGGVQEWEDPKDASKLKEVELKGIIDKLKAIVGDNKSVTADPVRNGIIIVDDPVRRKVYQKVLNALDIKRPLVRITARIVDVDVSDITATEHGFLINGSVRANGRDIPFDSGFNSSDEFKQTPPWPRTTAAASAPAALLKNPLGLVVGGMLRTADVDITARFRALEDLGLLHIRSAPSVVTLDNLPARITDITKQIAVIPGQWVSNPYQLDAGLQMVVTPRIMDGEEVRNPRVSLLIDLLDGQNDPTAGSVPRTIGPVNEVQNRISTQAWLRSGEQLLIGGHTRKETSNVRRAVPGLGRIPLLGKLFQRNRAVTSTVRRYYWLCPVVETTRDRPFLPQEAVNMHQYDFDLPDLPKEVAPGELPLEENILLPARR